MATAGTKGALADLSSSFLLQDGDVRPARTAAFALWNATYCGLAVYGMYSVWLPRVLPLVTASGARHPRATAHTALSVGFDNFIATPFLCLPTYYLWLGAVEAWTGEGRAFSASASLRRYADEAYETLQLSLALWVPIHTLTFSVVPVPLRTHFVACCSVCTLACMSMLQASLERRRGRGAAEAEPT